MGWLIALAIIIALAVLPLGASVKYDSGGVLVRLIAGPVRITLFPTKKKDPQKKEEKSQKEDKPKEEVTQKTKAAPVKKQETIDDLPEPEKPKEKSGGPITDFIPLVHVALDLLADLPGVFRVNMLQVKVVLAGDDPCDLATNYGRIWAAIGNLWPKLEEIFVIKKRDINVECDFTADQTLITARLDLTLTLGRVISLAVRYGVRALKEYLKIMKSRKGGAAI